MIKDIIPMVTASIGCLLGIYNFIYGIVKKRTKIDFYTRYANRTYKLVDSLKTIDGKYYYNIQVDSTVCFSIKNQSSKPVFFNLCFCDVGYFPMYSILYNIITNISEDLEKSNYFKYDNGDRISVMVPFKIEAYDISTIIYEVSYTYGFTTLISCDPIPRKENESIELYYDIDNKLYKEYLLFDIR